MRKSVRSLPVKSSSTRLWTAIVIAIAFTGAILHFAHFRWLAYARTLVQPPAFGVTTAPASSASVGDPAQTPAGGTAYPNAGWLPFKSGPLVESVASVYGPHPAMVPNSAAIVDNLWGNDTGDLGRLQMVLGGSDFYKSVYGTRAGQKVTESFFYSSASDPAYAMHCTIYGPCPSGVVHIPKGAMPAADSDHHLVIRDTARGKDFSFWQASIPSGQGGALDVSSGDAQDSVTGQGINIQGTAARVSTIWALRPQDVLAGRIPHALIVETTCDTSDDGNRSGSFVYPAASTDNHYYCGTNTGIQFPNNSGSDVNLKYGAHIWSDVPNADLPPVSGSCDAIGRAELRALNEFGAYVVDVGDVKAPFYILVASDVNDTYNGSASVWQQVLEPLTGNGASSSFQLSPSACGVDLQTHLHVLVPPPAR